MAFYSKVALPILDSNDFEKPPADNALPQVSYEASDQKVFGKEKPIMLSCYTYGHSFLNGVFGCKEALGYCGVNTKGISLLQYYHLLYVLEFKKEITGNTE